MHVWSHTTFCSSCDSLPSPPEKKTCCYGTEKRSFFEILRFAIARMKKFYNLSQNYPIKGRVSEPKVFSWFRDLKGQRTYNSFLEQILILKLFLISKQFKTI